MFVGGKHWRQKFDHFGCLVFQLLNRINSPF